MEGLGETLEYSWRMGGLTTKLSHPETKSNVRESGTERANPGWRQRLVRLTVFHIKPRNQNSAAAPNHKLRNVDTMWLYSVISCANVETAMTTTRIRRKRESQKPGHRDRRHLRGGEK
jgi:hypothetical protein